MNTGGIGFVEAVVIDVANLDLGMAFWSGVTGQDFKSSYEPNFRRAILLPGLNLVLQEVPEVKNSKNRVHLDIEVADLEAALKRVEAIGGTLVTRVDTDSGGHHIVCANPNGNEFCLVTG